MTNWGAHGLDQIQMALGTDGRARWKLWPLEWPQGSDGMRYANDVTVHMELPPAGNLMGGGRFIGEKGSIDIWRNNFKIDPPGIKVDLPPQEEIDKWHDKRALWQAQYHMGYLAGVHSGAENAQRGCRNRAPVGERVALGQHHAPAESQGTMEPRERALRGRSGSGSAGQPAAPPRL